MECDYKLSQMMRCIYAGIKNDEDTKAIFGGKIGMFDLMDATEGHTIDNDVALELREYLLSVSIYQLEQGNWIAYGFKVPVKQTKPQPIPVDYWRFLSLNLHDQKAIGCDLEFVGLHFRKHHLTQNNYNHSKLGGRPNKVGYVKQAFKERVQNKAIYKNWEDELFYLQKWYQKHHKSKVDIRTLKKNISKSMFQKIINGEDYILDEL